MDIRKVKKLIDLLDTSNVDEIEIQKKGGLAPYDAIMTSGVSRLRPIAMAALTTAMGMIPLLLDAFFISMAVTIIFGLMIATVLTTLVVPVFYTFFDDAREAFAAALKRVIGRKPAETGEAPAS